MNQLDDSAEPQMDDNVRLTEEQTDVWKETVRMDAIRIPHNAHGWNLQTGLTST